MHGNSPDCEMSVPLYKMIRLNFNENVTPITQLIDKVPLNLLRQDLSTLCVTEINNPIQVTFVTIGLHSPRAIGRLRRSTSPFLFSSWATPPRIQLGGPSSVSRRHYIPFQFQITFGFSLLGSSTQLTRSIFPNCAWYTSSASGHGGGFSRIAVGRAMGAKVGAIVGVETI